MAEIEEREGGDQGRVRHWLTRALTAPRDAAWVADGRVFPSWAPVSPVSGRVGAFEWKVIDQLPLREALEIEAPPPAPEPPAPPPRLPDPAPPAQKVEVLPPPRSESPKAEAPEPARAEPVRPEPARPVAPPPPRPTASVSPLTRPAPPTAPVLPPADHTPGLILAPDDPGTGEDEPADRAFRAF